MSNSKRPLCGCRPGTAENGWHEARDPECVRKEHSAWTQLIAAKYRRLRAGGVS